MKIKKIFAREILDSRGNPTVEVDLHTSKFMARASVPSGASTGKHEAVELRDHQKRYLGKGVKKAVRNINKKIAPKLKGRKLQQGKIDNLMIKLDNTKNKSRLGANAILAVSIAVCKARAMELGIPLYKSISMLALNKKPGLPVPFFNVINGGVHAGNELRFQEFMISPKAKSFSEALRMGSEIYHVLGKIVKKRYGKNAVNVGNEGGYAPKIRTAEQALNLLIKAIEEAGYRGKVRIAIDAAASEFYRNRYYYVPKKMKKAELLRYYLRLIKKYPIISIEDAFSQDDLAPFVQLTEKAGDKIQIIGDDLLVTNLKRIHMALDAEACNGLLLKVNQIGTVTEAILAAELALSNNWKVMVSHRSGETCDDFIADLAVGLGAGQIKAGAPCRGERLAKYNQLLRIEEDKIGYSE